MTDLSKFRDYGSSKQDELIDEAPEARGQRSVDESVAMAQQYMAMQEAAQAQANRPGDLLEEVLEAQNTTNGLLRDLIGEIKTLRFAMEVARGGS
jgi:hypothetical protein